MTEAWKHWEGHVVDGRFCLRQHLGGCRHSAVFLTEYGGPEPRKAAIKLLAADPRSTEIQLSRWELAATLSHPHLIRLFEMGRCRLSDMGLLYLVMEYADEGLSQVLLHRPLTSPEAREMLVPALDALAYLHGRGFVHGHLKPANVMAVDDQLKITSDGLCLAGELGGRPGKLGVYDPPEIAGGGVSPAGDVWSLGMTLVEALTQRPPAREGTEQEEPVLPQTLPAPFGDIALHCLRRDPRRRWTVADIAARLREISPGSPGQTTARAPEPFAKGRYIVPAAALGLALAATAVVVGPRLVNRRPEARRASSIPFEQPGVQPQPEPKPATPDGGQSTNRTSDEKRSSPGAPPAPLRSEALAKTPVGSLLPGEVVQQVLPEVPAKERNTIRGTVRVEVRVHVNPSGSVVGAKLDSPGPSRYFAELALQAARRWKFRAPQNHSGDASSEWVLRFEFARTATEVFPVRAAP